MRVFRYLFFSILLAGMPFGRIVAEKCSSQDPCGTQATQERECLKKPLTRYMIKGKTCKDFIGYALKEMRFFESINLDDQPRGCAVSANATTYQLIEVLLKTAVDIDPQSQYEANLVLAEVQIDWAKRYGGATFVRGTSDTTALRISRIRESGKMLELAQERLMVNLASPDIPVKYFTRSVELMMETVYLFGNNHGEIENRLQAALPPVNLEQTERAKFDSLVVARRIENLRVAVHYLAEGLEAQQKYRCLSREYFAKAEDLMLELTKRFEREFPGKPIELEKRGRRR